MLGGPSEAKVCRRLIPERSGTGGGGRRMVIEPPPAVGDNGGDMGGEDMSMGEERLD